MSNLTSCWLDKPTCCYFDIKTFNFPSDKYDKRLDYRDSYKMSFKEGRSSLVSHWNRFLKNSTIQLTSWSKYLPIHNNKDCITQIYFWASLWLVETICGKSINLGWSLLLSMILNSLKSQCIRPYWPSLTINFISLEKRNSGFCKICTWYLYTKRIY